MKTLIIGDSFSADDQGWPSLLEHDVVNRSQKGVGEYKIYKQSKIHEIFDLTIVCHTNPYRIHTPKHPIHNKSKDRPTCDFLLSDVDYHSKNNSEMKFVKEYWNKYYDFEYQEDIYRLLVSELFTLPNSIHITFHETTLNLIENNLSHIWKEHPGDINHLDTDGNRLVAESIKKIIKKSQS